MARAGLSGDAMGIVEAIDMVGFDGSSVYRAVSGLEFVCSKIFITMSYVFDRYSLP